MTPRDRELDGLGQREAARVLARDGPNELPRVRRTPVWRKLAAQLFHFFAVMLWAAGALAIVAGMPELGLAIFAVIVLNGAFAYVQERRAERAAEHLEALLPLRAIVRRDGRTFEIDAHDLVVGDVVLLGAGDRVSADVRIVDANSLSIDTSLLTGESVPRILGRADTAFAGSYVLTGEATGVVEATGRRTRLAEIAELTIGQPRPLTPLARELRRLVRTIAVIAMIVGVLCFAASVLVGLRASAGFLFGIGVMVALVPEGLLPTVTLSLAVGARRMAAQGALIRRLEAVEALGSTTFICTDKTGTLTENRMSAVEAWVPGGAFEIHGSGYEPVGEVIGEAASFELLRRLALAAARCSTGRAAQRDGKWHVVGDPMEAALHVLAMRVGVDVLSDETESPILERRPFDSYRRRMSVVVGAELLVKGAPDAVLPRCREVRDALATADRMADRGLRVLAIAGRPATEVLPGASPGEAEADLRVIGLIGLEDPPRSDAAAAIAACRESGMRVAMITGDHPGTARAIARKVGLGGNVVLSGQELPDDEAALGEMLDSDGIVVCRVSPEEKLRITRALQRRGHVVAMTGDGVNDGPALHQADVGVAMGRSGTDVARAAADLVLLNDDFAAIVAAIRQGRSTFANVRKVLAYHLTDNVAELLPFVVWALSASRIPLALGVLQILSLDLVTDQLPALALGVEPPPADVLQERPFGRHIVDRRLLVRSLAVIGLAEGMVELFAFGASLGWHRAAGAQPSLAAASGAAFSAVVIGQAANAFACRSETRSAWSTNTRPCSALVAAVAAEISLLLFLLYATPFAKLLGQAPPSLTGALVALLGVPAVLGADAALKKLAGPVREGLRIGVVGHHGHNKRETQPGRRQPRAHGGT